MTGRQPQAIRTALAVLAIVARSPAGLTARQVSAALAVPAATIYRTVRLLEAEGYLVRHDGDRRLVPGPRARDLASHICRSHRRPPAAGA